MINITRSKIVPQSLKQPKIQQYLDDLADYEEGVLTEKPKPPISYRNSDILEEFDKSFYSKCYLTEQKFINSYIMDIEHFVSKLEDETLRYEWTNLFPAEHNANMAKPRKTPKGGYLNPCDSNDDVESEIIYNVGFNGNKPSFSPLNPKNIKAVNTIMLLDKIHNGEKGKNSELKTAHLRFLIKKQFEEITNLIADLRKTTDEDQKLIQKNKLRLLLSRKASFTMLMRSSDIVQLFAQEFFD
ncbi:MAG: hypothetical protein AB8G11_17235 [Saprospiraceae bacterium]